MSRPRCRVAELEKPSQLLSDIHLARTITARERVAAAAVARPALPPAPGTSARPPRAAGRPRRACRRQLAIELEQDAPAARVAAHELHREPVGTGRLAIDRDLVRSHEGHRRLVGIRLVGIRLVRGRSGVRQVMNWPVGNEHATVQPAVEAIRRAEKVEDERIRRVFKHLVRRADLLDAAWFITTTRSATSSASSWSCVTKMLVTCISSCSRRSQRRSSLRTLASSAPNGSSSSSTCGSTASARASATRCRCPPESCDGIALAQPFELHQRQQLVHALVGSRLRRPLRPRPHAQAEGDVLEHASCAGTARSAGTRSRRCARCTRDVGRRLRRAKRDAVRVSGVSRPAMIRSSVVLPEPEGPSSATSSPSCDRQADVVAAP